MPLCYRASPIRLSRCADADRLCGYSCIGKGASYRAIVLSRYIVCIGAGVLALVGVLHQMSGSAPSCNRAGGRAIWAAGQQAAGVSYRAMHRAIGQLLGVGQTGRLRPCAPAPAAREMPNMWPAGRHQVGRYRALWFATAQDT